MHCAPRIAIVPLAVLLIGGCQQLNHSLVGPSPPFAASSTQLSLETATPTFGVASQIESESADHESFSQCIFFGAVFEGKGQRTRSSTGNETLHCHAQTDLPAMDEPIPAPLCAGGEGRIHVTPSGQGHLMCQTKTRGNR